MGVSGLVFLIAGACALICWGIGIFLAGRGHRVRDEAFMAAGTGLAAIAGAGWVLNVAGAP